MHASHNVPSSTFTLFSCLREETLIFEFKGSLKEKDVAWSHDRDGLFHMGTLDGLSPAAVGESLRACCFAKPAQQVQQNHSDS